MQGEWMSRSDIAPSPWRHALRIGVPIAVLIALTLVAASRFVKPAPPSRVTMSTGEPGGAYAEYARRYQAFLAQNGVTLELVPSHGAVENLARLKEGKADAAFVQGGLAASDADTDTDPAIVSLGALYYEPVWVFTRAPSPPARQLHDLIGHRIAVGEEGSGTRALAVQLLRSVGVGPKDATLSPKGNNEASAALLRGDVDAAIFVSGISAPVIRELIRGQDVRLVSIVHSTALARQHEYLSPITVARGLADVQADLPDHDITTVAVTANLLVRSDLHPALMYLLLDAASEINGRQSLLADAQTFPNPRRQDVPVADEALRFYQSGKPFLRRYLPFWLANLADRMLVYLIPLVAVLVPAIRFLPDILSYRPRARIAGFYERLRLLERDIATDPSAPRVSGYLARLDQIESEIIALQLPTWFVHESYALRAALDLVRDRLTHPGAKGLPGLRA